MPAGVQIGGRISIAMDGRRIMLRILALDIGGTSIKASLATLDGEGDMPTLGPITTRDVKGYDFPRLREAVLALAVDKAVDGIGISTTGTTSLDQVVLRSGFFAGYEMVSWQAELARGGLELPVAVLNDGHAAAVAENRTATDRDASNTTHFVVGTGIGGGGFVDGQLLLGTSGFAGAFGHVAVHPGDGLPRCGCTRLGCAEVLAAAPALLREIEAYRSGNGLGTNDDEIKTLRSLYSPESEYPIEDLIGIFRRAGWWLGRAIGSVVNILNPSLVTLGGGVVDADLELGRRTNSPVGPYVVAAFAEARESALTRAVEAVEFRLSHYGNRGGLVGAAIAGSYAAQDGKFDSRALRLR